MEVWNNVFSQFNNDGHGNYTDLIRRTSILVWVWNWLLSARMLHPLFDVDTNRALMDECGHSGSLQISGGRQIRRFPPYHR